MFKTALQGRRSLIQSIGAGRRFLCASPRCWAENTPNSSNNSSSSSSSSNKNINSHVEFLSKYYTPEMLQSIQITESLVKPEDLLSLKTRGAHAKSKVSPSHEIFDYATNDPKWDEPILYPNQPKKHTPFPEIPQIANPDRTDLKVRFAPSATDAPTTQRAGFDGDAITALSKLTGLDARYIRKLHVRPILMKRVSCQTGKGKIANFYAMTVVGNRNGVIGIGEGKSRDGMRVALRKAHWNAIKNLTPIPRYEERTIIGNIDYKYHAVKLFLRSAPAGFGLRVNPYIFEICQVAGIKDLGGKVYKSRNPMNTIKGFVEALTKQRSLEDLAAGRGKKLVDLRKVYYSA